MSNRARFSLTIILVLLITLYARPPSAHEEPAATLPAIPPLSAINYNSREGYFVLYLEHTPQLSLIVDYATDPSFTTISNQYPWFADFQQLTLSGFTDGEHYFRVAQYPAIGERQRPIQVSNTVKVTVQHYDTSLALSLLLFGAAIFVCLVGTILYFHTRYRIND